ncbi:MAG TPA: DNA polymerase I, partial [Acidiferrobacteraceae bacterium]|nr:DNA polymerase I [Acidiferrobacteraceae bacterium]
MNPETDVPLLVLVDGSSYLYRAFNALPKLSNARGEPTGALFGMLNMLERLRKDYRPAYFAVVLDAPGPTFRDQQFAGYKAQRAHMPDDLAAQIGPLMDIIRAQGVPLLVEAGVEADDVLATWCTRARDAGVEVLISTGDKDLAQLVEPGVCLINTMTGVISDAAVVLERYGVRPDQIVDYLTLTGDSADNIPGVPGVGPKTAARWLSEYGTLAALVGQAPTIPGKAGERLRESLAQLPLYRDLVTVRRDLALAGTLDDLRVVPPDTATLRQWYTRLEFRNLLSELGAEEFAAPAYEQIGTEEALEAWCVRLEQAPLIALDTETDSLDPVAPKLVGLSFSDRPGTGAYVPLAHTAPGTPPQLDRVRVLARLRSILEDPRRPKVLQNAKFDCNVLAAQGITLRGVQFDTMLESYVLDSVASRHDLDTLALRHLGRKTRTFEDVCGRGRNQITFDQVPLQQATPYAAEDADLALQVHAELWPRLQAVPSLTHVFRDLEMPLVPVLARMERAGVLIDAARLSAQGGFISERIAALEDAAHTLAGAPFNLASPAQVQRVLFEDLGLKPTRRTPKGAPSTAEEVLQELDHPLPGVILEHRSLCKLRDTYIDKLPRMIHPVTGRVHTCYHQAVAATGRLSSSDPNLQNIPIRTPEGRRIREAFVAPPGRLLLAADYSQIELRIMAHLSEDAGLLRAFQAGVDIHRQTAAEVFGVPLDAVQDEQRRAAKAINFGLIYGMSAFGLARQLRIDRLQAQAYCDLYFARYPGVRAFMDEMRARAHADGYVETLFGRRLYVPEIQSPNQARRQYAERTAINAPMQGTAADLIKRAMIAIDAWLTGEGVPATLILQVHDELVFEV